MGVWTLLEVSSMPILQVLIISLVGAFMATDYFNLLPADARKSLNKIVFVVFTPSLVFASLSRTVRWEDIISWWFMPVNIGMTFIAGGTLGWIVVKILKPQPHVQNLVIAMCSAGNLGNMLLIIIPAICNEDGNPFGDKATCRSAGLSYVSFSMAIGAFYIWTHTYYLIRRAGEKYKALNMVDSDEELSNEPNKDLEADEKALLLPKGKTTTFNKQIMGLLHPILEELKAPPIIAAFAGLIFGAVTWLRNLIIGNSAPLRVIDESITLLGDGTIPCITLILGGNLTQGLRKAKVKATTIIGVICVRYIMLPIIGIGVVRGATRLGFLPEDPLYHFILMIQFTLPPAMNIGTMTELFDVAQEECSVLFLWTYLVATLALTGWSSAFMWILS